MTEVPDLHDAAATGETTCPLVERRRPGRIDDVSPELIPLLRGQVSVSEPLDADLEHRTNRKLLSAERTITIVLILTALLWASVLLGGWSWLIEAPSEGHRAALVRQQGTAAASQTKSFIASPY